MADLVSRKPKASVADEPSSAAEEIKALEYRPVGEQFAEGVEKATSDQAAKAYLHDEGATAASAQKPARPTEELAATAAPIKKRKTPSVDDVKEETIGVVRENMLKASRKDAIIVPQQAADTKLAQPAPAITEASRTFIEELEELDAEVADLRLRLAKKLTEQNSQLRRMLARFEGR